MPLSASILSRLQYQHESIASLTTGISDADLRHRWNSEKWSALENIAHLAAYQPVFIKRMEMIKTNDTPLFDPYVGDKDPFFLESSKQALSMMIDTIAADRVAIIQLLTDMDDAQLGRMGRHLRYGL